MNQAKRLLLSKQFWITRYNVCDVHGGWTAQFWYRANPIVYQGSRKFCFKNTITVTKTLCFNIKSIKNQWLSLLKKKTNICLFKNYSSFAKNRHTLTTLYGVPITFWSDSDLFFINKLFLFFGFSLVDKKNNWSATEILF